MPAAVCSWYDADNQPSSCLATRETGTHRVLRHATYQEIRQSQSRPRSALPKRSGHQARRTRWLRCSQTACRAMPALQRVPFFTTEGMARRCRAVHGCGRDACTLSCPGARPHTWTLLTACLHLSITLAPAGQRKNIVARQGRPVRCVANGPKWDLRVGWREPQCTVCMPRVRDTGDR
jgi:hypothetical protein